MVGLDQTYLVFEGHQKFGMLSRHDRVIIPSIALACHQALVLGPGSPPNDHGGIQRVKHDAAFGIERMGVGSVSHRQADLGCPGS